MPLKPERSFPGLSKQTEIKSNEIASIIEPLIINFGKVQHGHGFRLNRFTEIAWNGSISPGKKWLHVELQEKSFDGGPFCLQVDFMYDKPGQEAMKALCNDLCNQTKLPIQVFYDGHFGFRVTS